MYKSIAIAVNMSVTGFGSWSVSCWFVCIYFYKFTLLNVIEIKPEKNCGTMSSLKCIVTYLKKNYPGSSIGRSPDLQAGVVVSITALAK